LTTKIIFSDGTVQFVKAEDAVLCNRLKEAQNDQVIIDLMKQNEASIELCESEEAGEAQCTIDLHKKKRASIKRMLAAFGSRR
jgi:hypothetical protein